MTHVRRHTIIWLANLGALAFLFFSTSGDRSSDYAQILDLLLQLETIETQLERDTVRIQSLNLQNFDPVLDGQRARNVALAALTTRLTVLDFGQAHRPRLVAASDASAETDRMLERITRSASKLNNARAALPPFTDALIAEIERRPHGERIARALRKLRENVGLYALNPGEELAQQVDGQLLLLTGLASAPTIKELQRPVDFENALTIARIIRDETEALETLADGFMARDLPAFYERIYDDLGTGHRAEIARVQKLVPLMHLLLAVVLAHTAYLLLKLVGANARLAGKAEDLTQSLKLEREMSERQRRFVSMVSHEFRTPLSIIDGVAQHFLQRPERSTPDKLHRGFENTRAAVRRLVHLMDTTLTVSLLHKRGLEIKVALIDLRAIVADVIDAQAKTTAAHEFSVRLDTVPAEYRGDGRLMRHVFANLVANATKYTPDGGQIEVMGKLENDKVVVSISDTGIGIPAADMDQLFAEYFRASNTAGISGTGVGLHLCKEIVASHGGSIEAASVEGEGTTMTVRLPLHGAHTNPSEGPSNRD